MYIVISLRTVTFSSLLYFVVQQSFVLAVKLKKALEDRFFLLKSTGKYFERTKLIVHMDHQRQPCTFFF